MRRPLLGRGGEGERHSEHDPLGLEAPSLVGPWYRVDRVGHLLDVLLGIHRKGFWSPGGQGSHAWGGVVIWKKWCLSRFLRELVVGEALSRAFPACSHQDLF